MGSEMTSLPSYTLPSISSPVLHLSKAEKMVSIYLSAEEHRTRTLSRWCEP